MKSALWILIATLLFAGAKIVIKLLAGVPLFWIIFIRGVVSLVLSSAQMNWRGISFFPEQKKLLFFRCLFGLLSMMLLFYVLQILPIGVATTLTHLSPIFTILTAAIFLGDTFYRQQGWATLLSFVGVVFLIQPWDQIGHVQLVPALLAVLGAFFAGCAYTCIRAISKRDPAIRVVFFFDLFTVLVSGALIWNTPLQASSEQWVGLIFVGAFIHIAQNFMTIAMQAEKAANFIAIFYLGALINCFVGWLYFDEYLPLIAIVGVLLVVGCNVYNTRFSYLKKL